MKFKWKKQYTKPALITGGIIGAGIIVYFIYKSAPKGKLIPSWLSIFEEDVAAGKAGYMPKDWTPSGGVYVARSETSKSLEKYYRKELLRAQGDNDQAEIVKYTKMLSDELANPSPEYTPSPWDV